MYFNYSATLERCQEFLVIFKTFFHFINLSPQGVLTLMPLRDISFTIPSLKPLYSLLLFLDLINAVSPILTCFIKDINFSEILKPSIIILFLLYQFIVNDPDILSSFSL